MKKILVLVFTILFVMLLTACGSNNVADLANSIADEASDAVQSVSDTEEPGTNEDVTPDDSADGPNVNVSSDAGNLQAGTDLSWPAAYMGDLPELSGTITAMMTADDNSTVAFGGITEDQAAAYVSSLESLGYQGYNFKDDDGIVFSGQNSAGAIVTFSFNSSNGESSITYAPPVE
jgi:uncharacterized lipoprotein